MNYIRKVIYIYLSHSRHLSFNIHDSVENYCLADRKDVPNEYVWL